MAAAILAFAAHGCWCRSTNEASPHPSAAPPDAAVAIDASLVSPPDAPPRALPTQLVRLFPDRRPEIPPALGIRFGEPIEVARARLPPDYAVPRINVLDDEGLVKQVYIEELAATTDDLRVLWGEDRTYGEHWFDPERGVRAIATESAGGITIRIERYQPLTQLLGRLPLRPGIGVRELTAALGGEPRADPPEVRLPPIEGDEKNDSTSIYVRRHGYSVALYGGRDDVHAALVARWGDPHVDDLYGPEVFVTSPRVTAEWRDSTGFDGAWVLTVGAVDEPR